MSRAGKLPAAITSGLGGLGGGPSVPVAGQDNDGFREKEHTSDLSQGTEYWFTEQ